MFTRDFQPPLFRILSPSRFIFTYGPITLFGLTFQEIQLINVEFNRESVHYISQYLHIGIQFGLCPFHSPLQSGHLR